MKALTKTRSDACSNLKTISFPYFGFTMIKTTASPSCPFLFIVVFAVLLFTGCTTQKPFYSFPLDSDAYAQATDSVTSLQPLAEAVVRELPASPDSYPLMASTAAPTSALPMATSRPQAIALRPSATVIPNLPAPAAIQKGNILPKEMSSKEETSPRDKSIISLVAFGLLFSSLSVLVGVLGILAILYGSWLLLGIYMLTALAGAIASALALSKIRKSPDPTLYEKDRRIAKIGVLLSLIPAVLILFFAIVIITG